ncbi:MAG: protein-L-isoaspartate(D-aspartate) O-methyltransferase [Myxococcota bacterium]
MIRAPQADAFHAARERMVREQLEARGIADPRVLAAMRRVPRHLFVPPDLRARAYGDFPLPVGADQTVSQPFIVARMAELAELEGGERVLEVGLGSGYGAAVLAELAREVFAVELVPELAARARETLASLGSKVVVGCFDATRGWPEHAPYDAIVVTAGAPRIPALLLAELAEGGRLVVPVGERAEQALLRVRRTGDRYDRVKDVACRFVDLRGRYGWGGEGSPQA